MVWIGDLNDNRVDHGYIEAGGHPVIEQSCIEQASIIAVDVGFVQRPADPLDDTTLNLPRNKIGLDGLARVLKGGITQNIDLAGFGIDLDIHDVTGDTRPQTG